MIRAALLFPITAMVLFAQGAPERVREPRRQTTPLAEQFGYRETTRINGAAPVIAAVASDGHHMARTSPREGEVVDLDKQTVTSIDYVRKEYSVITFADLKKSTGALQFKTSVTKTGKTKEISCFNVYQIVFKIEGGGKSLTADTWLVGGISGYQNILLFHQLGLPPGQGALMSELMKQTAKVTGIPMQQTITITGAGKRTEIVRDLSLFSGASNAPSKFAVPAGFKKVRPRPIS
jgi:hypothetical protein